MAQPLVALNPLRIAIGHTNGDKPLSMVVICIRDYPQHWEIRPRLANEVNGQRPIAVVIDYQRRQWVKYSSSWGRVDHPKQSGMGRHQSETMVR